MSKKTKPNRAEELQREAKHHWDLYQKALEELKVLQELCKDHDWRVVAKRRDPDGGPFKVYRCAKCRATKRERIA